MRSISHIKYFLPLILAAFLVTAATAKAELEVVVNTGEEFPWRDHFSSDQWEVLNFGVGRLVPSTGSAGTTFFLYYTEPFTFAATDGSSHTVLFTDNVIARFDDYEYTGLIEGDNVAHSKFEFERPNGKLSSLIFYLYGGSGEDDFTETSYEVDFEKTAELQNGTATPEPATMLIFGLGTLAAGACYRRRRK